jgi:VanZ family protein
VKANRKCKAKRLNEPILSATVRWTLTLIWTALTASLLLSPSGRGTPVSFISQLFGGTDTSDAVGHVIITTILALLWCWTISLYATTAQTTGLILIGGIVWGFGAELSQHFVPERGASLLDLGANTLGVLIGLVVYRLLIAFLSHEGAS